MVASAMNLPARDIALCRRTVLAPFGGAILDLPAGCLGLNGRQGHVFLLPAPIELAQQKYDQRRNPNGYSETQQNAHQKGPKSVHQPTLSAETSCVAAGVVPEPTGAPAAESSEERTKGARSACFPYSTSFLLNSSVYHEEEEINSPFPRFSVCSVSAKTRWRQRCAYSIYPIAESQRRRKMG